MKIDLDIRKVAILGASGTMGSLTGGIVAQNGIKAYFLSRKKENAESGLERAISQARSRVISRNVICADYDTMLVESLKKADWIIECLNEDIGIKRLMYEKVDRYRKPTAIVSSMTSSLPLSDLCEGMSDSFKNNFLGVHFYNPPAKLTACEIAAQEHTNSAVIDFMKGFLKNKLSRIVIPVRNTAAYAGNRIGFFILNKITAMAYEYGVEMIDYLIGPYTGRIMPPLRTIDLVGLDIHNAIIDSLYKHTHDTMHGSLVMPGYIKQMIDIGYLGDKTPAKGGFYKKDADKNRFVIKPDTLEYIPVKKIQVDFVEAAKNLLHLGIYKDAFELIKASSGKEVEIVREILLTYIAYAYSCIGEVTDETYGIDGIDEVIAFGYNWAPPSVMVDMLGGSKAVAAMLEHSRINVPQTLLNINKTPDPQLNVGRFFIAR